MEGSTDVLRWYNLNQPTIPMIYRFALLLFSIPPSQIENERDFSLAGIIGRSRRSSLTVKNLSTLVFINKNRDVLQQSEKLGKLNIFDDDISILNNQLDDDVHDEIDGNDSEDENDSI